MPLQHDSFILSSPGGRAVNEDACDAFRFGPDRFGREYFGWVLADGLGGHRGGETAARTAVEAISRYLAAPSAAPGSESASESGTSLSGQALDGALRSAQSAILAARQREPRLARMHTTAVLLVSDGLRARWAHLGDSRLYHFRAGRLAASTRDHSVSYLLHLAGDIPWSAIRDHEDRNRLLRSLGSEGTWKPDILAQTLPLQPADAFLLCSDGFWEHVLEPEMETDLAATPTAEEWIRKMERRLLAKAPKGHDNYSAIAVKCNNE